MMDAATYAVAAVNGAFEVNIVIQRLPSFRKMRATVTSLPIKCQSELRALKPIWREYVSRILLHKQMELVITLCGIDLIEVDSDSRQYFRNLRLHFSEYVLSTRGLS